MKLSMWIIADWLKEYKPNIEIKSGDPTIENIRLFTTDMKNMVFSKHTLYLGYKKDLFASSSNVNIHNGIICTNNNDILSFETNDLYELLNELLTAIDFYNQWHESLHMALTKNCQLSDLLSLSYKVLPFPLAVIDTNNMVIALSSHFPVGSVDEVWDDMITKGSSDIQKIIELKSLTIMQNKPKHVPFSFKKGVFPNNNYNINIYLNSEFIAELIMIELSQPVTSGMLYLYQILGTCITQWFELYSNHNDVFLPEHYLRSLLDGSPEYLDNYKRYLKIHLWHDDDVKILLCIQGLSDNYSINNHLSKRLSRDFKCTVNTVYHSYIILIANLAGCQENMFLSDLSSYLKNSNYYAGKSQKFHDISIVSKQYVQAELALKNGTKTSGFIHDCNDYLFLYALKILKSSISISFCHPALAQLRAYDEKRHTELYKTLFEYLKQERNQISTARVLHIHRNSCIYRLKRIQELLDLDLDNIDTRSYLLFSFFYAEAFSEQ